MVGFGEGHEADFLQQNTEACIFGIDIRSRIPNNVQPAFSPILASAMALPFNEGIFDFVFYHHVIEHVPDPVQSIAEISRKLIGGGLLYIGTPNRNRIIGYLGAYKISFWRILRNNFLDYKYRIIGKFHNDQGAHAGFTKNELMKMSLPFFPNQEWLTSDYLTYKYHQTIPAPILKFLIKPAIMNFAAPSVYLLCKKPL